MQQVVNDENKSRRQSFIYILRFLTGIAEVYPTGDDLEQSLRSWLSPPDHLKKHSVACESRHRGSAAWFVQGDTFTEWKSSEARSSLLWVHGKRPFTLGSFAFTN